MPGKRATMNTMNTGTAKASRQRWETFTDAEITRAVELMISPEDLSIRDAALALFAVFGYTPEDVREQLDSGEYFNAGAVFDGLNTDSPRIAIPRP